MSFDKNDLNSFYKYAFSLCHDEAKSFDLVSMAIEAYLKQIFIINKKGFIKKCIRNNFIDQIRLKDNQNQKIDHYEDFISFDDFESRLIAKNQIESILLKLNYDEREILFLWAHQGYTLQEISNLLNLPKGTLSSKLKRIKDKIKKEETHG